MYRERIPAQYRRVAKEEEETQCNERSEVLITATESTGFELMGAEHI